MWQREQALKVVSGGSSKASQLAQAREEVASFFGSFEAIFFSADSSLLFFAFLGDYLARGCRDHESFLEPGKIRVLYTTVPHFARLYTPCFL